MQCWLVDSVLGPYFVTEKSAAATVTYHRAFTKGWFPFDGFESIPGSRYSGGMGSSEIEDRTGG